MEIFCIVESILLRFKAFNLLTKPFLFRLSRKKKICKNMEATDSSLIHICSPWHFYFWKNALKKKLCLEHNSKKINSKPIGAIAENIDWLFLGNGLDSGHFHYLLTWKNKLRMLQRSFIWHKFYVSIIGPHLLWLIQL